MKKINYPQDAKTRSLESQPKIYTGQTTRRSFIAGLLKLGVSLPLAGLVAAQTFSLSGCSEYSESEYNALADEYDYIIVGAGSAGCVLADRLSATGATVLLIEAGGNHLEQPTVVDCLRWVENIGSPLDWNYPISPQPFFNNRAVATAAGKGIGGGGSINGMHWLRGDLRDAIRWQELVGSYWSPENLYAAFKKVENYLPADNPNRSNTGVIDVGRYATANPITAASIEGANSLGVKSTDHNSTDYIDGVGVADVNISPDGRRSGPAQTYLARAIERSNLTVITDALVTRLELTGTTCHGVNVIVEGELRQITAQREVLLCAGVIGSPRILMQSGIGPENVLKAAGIPVQHSLSQVGENLHDHLIMQNITFNAGPELTPDETYGRVATHSFIRTNPNNEAPNLQVMCMQGFFPPDPVLSGEGFSIMPWLAKTQSRGSCMITSADPKSPMHIDYRYLSAAVDREAMVVALDLCIALGLSDSMSPFSDGLRASLSPSMSQQEKYDFVANNSTPGLHSVGSCSAGSAPDNSVVDSYFRVWGIDQLRVVDASVIPEVPGVGPHALIITLAELAAQAMGYD